jgi:hypothetical protein
VTDEYDGLAMVAHAALVTKGERRTRAISRPLTRPISAASISARSAASAIVAPGSCAAAVADKKRISIMVTTALSAQTEPTDRSMPPLMMTKVSPSDISHEMRLGAEILKEVKAPIKIMAGEHDWFLDMGETWQELFGPPSYSFDWKGVHVVTLMSVQEQDFWTARHMSPQESALAVWYRARTADSRRGTRKTMIVALARKLVIALWRFVTTGERLEGVVLRPAS